MGAHPRDNEAPHEGKTAPRRNANREGAPGPGGQTAQGGHAGRSGPAGRNRNGALPPADGVLVRLGGRFSHFFELILPDPLVLAVLITIGVFAAAFFFGSAPEIRTAASAHRSAALVGIWFDGVWNPGFLQFALQMCLVLLTGFGVAKSPPVAAGIERLAHGVRTPRGAVLLVAIVSCCGCWLNWGFGLIAGGVLAAELGRRFDADARGRTLPLLVASAYAGMMIWHGGMSGSAPLKVAKSGVEIGTGSAMRVEIIDVARTILSLDNLILSALFIIGIPLLLSRFAPKAGAMLRAPTAGDAGATDRDARRDKATGSIAEGVNRWRGLSFLLGVLGASALVMRSVASGTGAIDLNFVNLLFLSLGLLLHRNLIEYVIAVTAGGGAIVGIVIQFPLYAGIQGLMQHSGLSTSISDAFVHCSAWAAHAMGVAEATTFPIAAFFSAGLVNFFVPSGGGQWIVQGTIMCNAAHSLGLRPAQAVMAVAYGDEWTNMIQPFWAIPLMGLTGVNARSFMGYCVLLMLLAMPVFMLALVLF